MKKKQLDNRHKDFNHLKEWLEPKLAAKGLTPEKFAYECGITRAAVYFYLADTNRPSVQVMVRMCRVLGVPLEEGLRQYSPRRTGRPPMKG